ncbi:MAG: hypothetical protein HKN25_09680 [Pyrinomonadaceae bacterium]|nr:hypothetical protein [Pyrinomonadaceae bacterium]
MSISVKPFFSLFAAVVLIWGMTSTLFSQDLDVEINIDQKNPNSVIVKGRVLNDKLGGKNWVFLREFAGEQQLARRVSDMALFGVEAEKIPVRKFADGEFVAERSATTFEYEINLKSSNDSSGTPHVSWMRGSNGQIMLNDLLPQFGNSSIAARVSFKLPNGWRVAQSEQLSDEGYFLVDDVENAVFLVGSEWREVSGKLNGISIYSLGEWQFEDSEALEMAESIASEYSRLFKNKAPVRSKIFLLPFPGKTRQGRWQAETRGQNITIMSASMPFKNQALQRLHEQLRHEIFHLWIPNRLNLTGNYAWFYEGFAVYQALKTGVWLGQIRFEDFLSTIGRAHDLHLRSTRDLPLSGRENMPSNNISASVYSKGMLVAFLTDVAILRNTKGKKSIAGIFRNLPFKEESDEKPLDGNAFIEKVMVRRPELAQIVQKYIRGQGKIDWGRYLKSIGVVNQAGSGFARLRVKSKLTGREKALLKKLGYNRWRKFIKRTK